MVAVVDWKLEVIVLPVADVDRAKEFYAERLGFPVDVDYRAGESFRVVQLTPPGSTCSISLMPSEGEPAPIKGIQVVVADIEAARAEVAERGAEVTDFFHFVDGAQVTGLHPERANFGSFFAVEDPDGHTWTVQEKNV